MPMISKSPTVYQTSYDGYSAPLTGRYPVVAGPGMGLPDPQGSASISTPMCP